MDARSLVGWLVTALLVSIAVLIVASQLLGYPPLIGYVETGSMEPTMEPGDGFLAAPAPLAGDVSEGDVVTFEAHTIGDGGLTTHRVVEETPEGYVTRGDANTFDDQEAGEPPVQESQIVSVAVQVGGDVVVIPYVGSVAESIDSGIETVVGSLAGVGLAPTRVGSVTTIVGLTLIVASLLYEFLSSSGRSSTRSTSRESSIHSGWVLLVIVLVVTVPITTSMLIPSGSDDVQVVSTTNPIEDDPTRLAAGDSDTITYGVENNMVVPRVVVLEPRSAGVDFSEKVLEASHGERVETQLELSVPEETGVYVRSRSEHHYLHVLPTRLLVALHDVHPAVAIGAINLVFVAPIAFLFLLVVGFRPISLRDI